MKSTFLLVTIIISVFISCGYESLLPIRDDIPSVYFNVTVLNRAFNPYHDDFTAKVYSSFDIYNLKIKVYKSGISGAVYEEN